MPAPFTILHPDMPGGLLVFDSPHSGRTYPDDFGFTCPRVVLERAEDRFLDKLLHWAPDMGVPLLLAQFPRTYIDVNRAVSDVDETMLDAPWPDAQPTELCQAGIGLIRRLLTPTLPVYSHALPVRDLQHRIASYYDPYHTALSDLLGTYHAQYGVVMHVDWHSMPSRFSGNIRMPDFVLGTRHGTTCPSPIAAAIQDTLRQMGYSVQVDDPYPGQEIIRRTGHPDRGYFAMQIEINKSLYLDEGHNKLHVGHTKLASDLRQLTIATQGIMQDYCTPLAAD